MPPLNLVLLGPPGSGKGTQAQGLAAVMHVPHISSGDLFRRLILAGGPLAAEAAPFVERGDYVPDHLTDELVAQRLGQADTRRGFILDGYPRTLPQAAILDRALAASKRQIDAAIDIDVPQALLEQRLAGRLTAGVRGDDLPEIVRRRLEVHRIQTVPLIAYYRDQGKLITIDGSASPEVVSRRILEALGPSLNQS